MCVCCWQYEGRVEVLWWFGRFLLTAHNTHTCLHLLHVHQNWPLEGGRAVQHATGTGLCVAAPGFS